MAAWLTRFENLIPQDNSHPAAAGADAVFLLEDPLFFRQYPFHKQKLMLHRATMKRYAREAIPRARYFDAHQLNDTGDIAQLVTAANRQTIRVVDPCDDWLRSKLRAACASGGIARYEEPVDDRSF